MNKLRLRRRINKLTQAQLALKSNVRLLVINRVENEHVELNTDQAERLSNVLNCKPNDLMKGKIDSFNIIEDRLINALKSKGSVVFSIRELTQRANESKSETLGSYLGDLSKLAHADYEIDTDIVMFRCCEPRRFIEKHEESSSLSDRIRLARLRKGWTQIRLAREINKSNALISRYERGFLTPCKLVTSLLEDVLNTSLTDEK